MTFPSHSIRRTSRKVRQRRSEPAEAPSAAARVVLVLEVLVEVLHALHEALGRDLHGRQRLWLCFLFSISILGHGGRDGIGVAGFRSESQGIIRDSGGYRTLLPNDPRTESKPCLRRGQHIEGLVGRDVGLAHPLQMLHLAPGGPNGQSPPPRAHSRWAEEGTLGRRRHKKGLHALAVRWISVAHRLPLSLDPNLHAVGS